MAYNKFLRLAFQKCLKTEKVYSERLVTKLLFSEAEMNVKKIRHCVLLFQQSLYCLGACVQLSDTNLFAGCSWIDFSSSVAPCLVG